MEIRIEYSTIDQRGYRYPRQNPTFPEPVEPLYFDIEVRVPQTLARDVHQALSDLYAFRDYAFDIKAVFHSDIPPSLGADLDVIGDYLAVRASLPKNEREAYYALTEYLGYVMSTQSFKNAYRGMFKQDEVVEGVYTLIPTRNGTVAAFSTHGFED